MDSIYFNRADHGFTGIADQAEVAA